MIARNNILALSLLVIRKSADLLLPRGCAFFSIYHYVIPQKFREQVF
jgi:hypothetical protein